MIAVPNVSAINMLIPMTGAPRWTSMRDHDEIRIVSGLAAKSIVGYDK